MVQGKMTMILFNDLKPTISVIANEARQSVPIEKIACLSGKAGFFLLRRLSLLAGLLYDKVKVTVIQEETCGIFQLTLLFPQDTSCMTYVWLCGHSK